MAVRRYIVSLKSPICMKIITEIVDAKKYTYDERKIVNEAKMDMIKDLMKADYVVDEVFKSEIGEEYDDE